MATQSYPEAYFGGKISGPSINRRRRKLSYREELEDFIATLPEGACVLDVGCGEGRSLYRAKERRPDLQLSGIDISNVAVLLPEGTVFIRGSVEDLAQLCPNDSYDAVICQHVIEHLASPLNLISGIRSVLKPGGKVFIETPNWTRLIAPFSFLYFWNDYTHVRPYSLFALNRLLLEHGFSVNVLRSLSTCDWRIPRFMRKSETSGSTGGQKGPATSSAFAHTHNNRGVLAKGFAYLINPLLRDLLITVGTKEQI